MFLLHLFEAAFSTPDNHLSHESAELVTNWLLFSAHGSTLAHFANERKPDPTYPEV